MEIWSAAVFKFVVLELGPGSQAKTESFGPRCIFHLLIFHKQAADMDIGSYLIYQRLHNPILHMTRYLILI